MSVLIVGGTRAGTTRRRNGIGGTGRGLLECDTLQSAPATEFGGAMSGEHVSEVLNHNLPIKGQAASTSGVGANGFLRRSVLLPSGSDQGESCVRPLLFLCASIHPNFGLVGSRRNKTLTSRGKANTLTFLPRIDNNRRSSISWHRKLRGGRVKLTREEVRSAIGGWTSGTDPRATMQYLMFAWEEVSGQF